PVPNWPNRAETRHFYFQVPVRWLCCNQKLHFPYHPGNGCRHGLSELWHHLDFVQGKHSNQIWLLQICPKLNKPLPFLKSILVVLFPKYFETVLRGFLQNWVLSKIP